MQASTPQHKEWKAKVVAVLERSLGASPAKGSALSAARCFNIGLAP